MDRTMLRDDYSGSVLNACCQAKASDPGCSANDNRRLVEAGLWIMHGGSRWRDLPAEPGHRHRTYVRFSRWRDKGARERVAQAMRGDTDMEHQFIDSTIVRAPSSG